MTSLITNILPNRTLSRAPALVTSTQRWTKASKLSRRWYTRGSPSSETPSLNDPRWKAVFENIELDDHQRPLSQEDIQRGQRSYKVEKRLSELTDMVGELMNSNKRLHGEMHRIIHLLTKQ
ncbi:hypothetical protein PHSC3_002028 [Chlamydiales bacterium STE3]|nr:hypothetical protein PHSC3_002028 [Chlamydiales bacterium STE3]